MTDSDAIGRARERFQREADRLREQVRDADAERERVEQATRVEPAQDADQAAEQLGEIRARLDRDLGALEARLPPRHVLATLARTVGGAAGAGVALLSVAGIVLRRRRARQAHERDLRIQAAEIARFLPGAVDADHPGAQGSGGRGGRAVALLGLLAAGAAAGFVAFQRLRGRDDGTPGGTPPPRSG